MTPLMKQMMRSMMMIVVDPYTDVHITITNKTCVETIEILSLFKKLLSLQKNVWRVTKKKYMVENEI